MVSFRVKTPGGRLVFQYLAKKASGVKCGDCGNELLGVIYTFIDHLLMHPVDLDIYWSFFHPIPLINSQTLLYSNLTDIPFFYFA